MKIGFEVKPFNYNLKSRRLELGYTQKELAIDARVQPEFIGRLELLKMPGKIINRVRAKMNRVADCLEADFSWLFPQDYLDAIQHELLPRRKRSIIWAIDMNLLQSVNDMPHSLPSSETEIIETDMKNDLSAAIGNAMSSLSVRQRKIIEMRFGMDGNDPATLEEVGYEFGVTIERIRQIETQALRKLRHPLRSRPLREVQIIEG